MSALAYQGSAAAAAVIMSHSLRSKKVIFVEGPSDGRLLNSLLGNSAVEPIPAKGAYGVIQALDQIAEHNAKGKDIVTAIGFIDQDYLVLRDVKCILDRSDIVTTFYRDIEIDLFHTSCTRRLLEEKGGSGKWSNEADVVSGILRSLHKFSLLRAYNAVNTKSWSFQGIDLDRYVSTSGIVDEAKLFSAFRQQNHIKDKDWSDFEQWAISVELCPKSVARGHDVALTFGKMLRKALGNRAKHEVAAEVVEENLRLAAERRFIEAYNWFKKLLDWIGVRDAVSKLM